MRSKYTASERLQLIEEYKSSGKTIAVFLQRNLEKNKDESLYSYNTKRTKRRGTYKKLITEISGIFNWLLAVYEI